MAAQAVLIAAAAEQECAAVVSASTAKPPLSEEAVLATKERLSRAKHTLIDLQTRKSLADSLASADPFAHMDSNKDAAGAHVLDPTTLSRTGDEPRQYCCAPASCSP